MAEATESDRPGSSDSPRSSVRVSCAKALLGRYWRCTAVLKTLEPYSSLPKVVRSFAPMACPFGLHRAASRFRCWEVVAICVQVSYSSAGRGVRMRHSDPRRPRRCGPCTRVEDLVARVRPVGDAAAEKLKLPLAMRLVTYDAGPARRNPSQRAGFRGMGGGLGAALARPRNRCAGNGNGNGRRPRPG